MSEPTPEESREHMRTLVNGIRERDAVIKELLAQLPSDGQGRWRQGTKNPRNLYVHQGDDQVGKPVGQMYSAQLAALVCDAVNVQQADLAAERDQLQAAIDRARALATPAERTYCGAGWTLDPGAILAALNQNDLPAIGEFAAGLDPHKETPDA